MSTENASEDGVIADVLDGQVAKDLMQKGTQAVRKVLKFFFIGYLRPEIDFCFLAKLGRLPPIQESFLQDNGRGNACVIDAATCATSPTGACSHGGV